MDSDLLLLIVLGWLAWAAITVVVWFWPGGGVRWRHRTAAPPVPGWPVVSPDRVRELRDMPYDDYLRTPEWTQRSLAVRNQAGWRCAICGSPHRLQAHHLTYRRRGNERPSDLQVLCDACHRQVHESA